MTDPLGWHSLGQTIHLEDGEARHIPIETCHIGADAAVQMASFSRERCGKRVLVVSDENTRNAAGEAPFTALSAVGKSVEEKVFDTEKPLDASDTLGRVVAKAGQDVDFYVAIGSGTVCDLAKYAGSEQDKPVLLYPTAASMNGYTSAIVALKVNGLKSTLPCAPALGIFADPAVVATAPIRMTAAGVADFLSKASSGSDWWVGHYLRGGYYTARAKEFIDCILDDLIAAAPGVGEGNLDAVAVVLEALLLSGLSMVVAGSSSPASGGEHLLSHYIDMKHSLFGSPNDLHGAQVGVGTIHCLGLWERVLALEPDRIDIEACVDAQPSDDKVRAWINEDWGPIADSVWDQWQQKRLTPDALRAELTRVREELHTIREGLRDDLLPPETVAAAISAAGGPITPEDLTIDVDDFSDGVDRARFIRNRFTVLDLAAELGLT
jgi:glycerol-1-phosphate dehydrogenase [NAD(P)+]